MRLSLRTGTACHFDHDYILRLLDALKECGNPFDEVWLATSYGIPSVERVRKEVKDMAWAAEQFKAAGITPSMQVSRTIGHHESALKSFGGEGVLPTFLTVMSIDGVTCPGVFCWNSPDFRQYVRETLEVYAAWKPEIAWVDDDIRLRLIAKSKALCFCDNCLAVFNEKMGTDYTRETLKPVFYGDPKVREQYINVQRETLADFAGLITEAVTSVSPDTVIGFQNGGNTTMVTDTQKAIIDKIIEVSGKAPTFRAGGGFYDDHKPDVMLTKSLILNYMNARLPKEVTARSCEIENLPWTVYGKSPECTCLEAIMYLAYGCNEASVTLMSANDHLSFHKRLFKKLAQHQPYFDVFNAAAKDTVNGGMVVYQPPKAHLVKADENGEPFFNDTCIWDMADAMRWGIPWHVSPVGNCYFLTAKAVDYLTDEDMEFLSRETVLLDANTLKKLVDKGLGGYINARTALQPELYRGGVFEYLSDHPVSKSVSWDTVRIRASAPMCIVGEGVEELSHFNTIVDGTPIGAATVLASTVNGAKWVVSAAELQGANIPFARRELLRTAIDAVAKKPLPAYVATQDQVVCVPREDANGKVKTVTLLNVSLTDTEELEVVVANPADPTGYTYFNPYGKPERRPFAERDGRFIATLPPLRSWRAVSILM